MCLKHPTLVVVKPWPAGQIRCRTTQVFTYYLHTVWGLAQSDTSSNQTARRPPIMQSFFVRVCWLFIPFIGYFVIRYVWYRYVVDFHHICYLHPFSLSLLHVNTRGHGAGSLFPSQMRSVPWISILRRLQSFVAPTVDKRSQQLLLEFYLYIYYYI